MGDMRRFVFLVLLFFGFYNVFFFKVFCDALFVLFFGMFGLPWPLGSPWAPMGSPCPWALGHPTHKGSDGAPIRSRSASLLSLSCSLIIMNIEALGSKPEPDTRYTKNTKNQKNK